MSIQKLRPSFVKELTILNDSRFVVELVPSAGTKNPEQGWRERAKKGQLAMYYSVKGDVGIGDEVVGLTIAIDAVKDGQFVELGIEPEGADKDGNALPKRIVSQYQAPHCARFHIAEDGTVAFDENAIITPDGSLFPLSCGIKYLVFKANGKTLKLSDVRLVYTEKDGGRVYADAHASGFDVVDAPKAAGKGAAFGAEALGLARAPKQVVTQAARTTAAAVPATVSAGDL